MPCTHIWCVEKNFVWVQRLSKVKRGTLQKRTNTINFQPHTTSTLSSQLTELTVNTMAPSKTIFIAIRLFKCSIIDSQLLSIIVDHVQSTRKRFQLKSANYHWLTLLWKVISFVECIKVEASLGQVYPIFSIKIYIANLHIFPITFGFHFAELNTIVLFSL